MKWFRELDRDLREFATVFGIGVTAALLLCMLLFGIVTGIKVFLGFFLFAVALICFIILMEG